MCRFSCLDRHKVRDQRTPCQNTQAMPGSCFLCNFTIFNKKTFEFGSPYLSSRTTAVDRFQKGFLNFRPPHYIFIILVNTLPRVLSNASRFLFAKLTFFSVKDEKPPLFFQLILTPSWSYFGP